MNEAQQYSINPVFAGHLANQLREDTDDLHVDREDCMIKVRPRNYIDDS